MLALRTPRVSVGQRSPASSAGTLHPATKRRGSIRCRAGKDSADDEPPKTQINYLEGIIRRKAKQIEAQIQELGMEGVEERLQSAVQVPAQPPHRMATMIAEMVPQGQCALIFEVSRPSPSSTSQDVANLAKQYVGLGANGIAVRTDADSTPEGLKDLWSVRQAVKVPVLARDWFIHPLQVVEAKEAGAAGVIGIVAQICGRGTAVMSSFSAALGMDCPVEVVNTREVQGLDKTGVAFYGINLGVGISIAIPGFANDMAHGLLGELPFGCISMVGVRSIEDARKARMSGADSLLIKRELIEQYKDNLQQLSNLLQYATSLDD